MRVVQGGDPAPDGSNLSRRRDDPVNPLVARWAPRILSRMCSGCWDEYGRPDDWNPDVAQALTLVQRIYQDSPVGAPLHVALDDWNLDGTIRVWPDDDLSPETMAAAEELAALFNRMPVSQRAATLAYHRRFLPVPS